MDGSHGQFGSELLKSTFALKTLAPSLTSCCSTFDTRTENQGLRPLSLMLAVVLT